MSNAPSTRPSLLLRGRDSTDADAWRQFVDVYAPLVYRFARKRGLQDADAADLTQIVLQALTREVRRLEYDPRRGSFRGWLFTVVRNQLHNYVHRRGPMPQGSGNSDMLQRLHQQPQPEQDDSPLWDLEYERRIFEWAAERVREQFEEATWSAFWQTAVEGRSGKEVAAALGVSVGAVYTAKSRVLDRMKDEIRALQGEAEDVETQ